MKPNVTFRDNASVIGLLDNGKDILGKRVYHFDIRRFCATDLIAADKVTVKYFLTKNMLADYVPKLLVGTKFKVFRDIIMNLSGKYHSQVR